MGPPSKRSKITPSMTCCVRWCKNNSTNSPGTTFYSFSTRAYKKTQRERWIQAVNRNQVSEDGTLWKPKKHTRICSRHFVGNKKSEHPLDPSFVPTIFPEIKKYGKSNKKGGNSKYPDIAEWLEEEVAIMTDQECQVDDLVKPETTQDCKIFICNRFVINNVCEAQVQAFIPQDPPRNKRPAVKLCGQILQVKLPPKNLFVYADFSAFQNDRECLQLLGVTRGNFRLLLHIIPEDTSLELRKTSKTTRLLIFLLKLKLGLKFAMLGKIFSIPKNTISHIFFYLLIILARRCAQVVRWPAKQVMQWKDKGILLRPQKNCKVIIDSIILTNLKCTKVPIKCLLGCTPQGVAIFTSKFHRNPSLVSDTQITKKSGILNLLDPEDLTLADHSFRCIKTVRKPDGKRVTIFMAAHRDFSKDQLAAFVRHPVEKTIQKTRLFRILDRLSSSRVLGPFRDEIFNMCCVLANLQNKFYKETAQKMFGA